MPDTYKLQYDGMTLTYPGLGGYVGYDYPSGTYVDILYKATAAGGVGEHSGTLTHSIYDYDMIKIWPRSVSSEAGIQTMYCPKDIPPTGNFHVWTHFGGGNFYMTDTVMTMTNGSAFVSTGINGGTYAGMRQVTTSTAGSTAKFERHSSYSNDNARIHLIIGENYHNNRDLLFSASTTAVMPQTISLTNSITAYDRLQIKISTNNDRASGAYEYAGYWTEHHNFKTDMPCKLSVLAGEGGACYVYQFVGGFDSAGTTLSMVAGKPLVWSVINNNAVTQTPNTSGYYYVSEIWGVKE